MKKFLSSSFAVLLTLAALGFVFYKYVYVPRVQQVSLAARESAESFLIKSILIDPALIVYKGEGKVLDITARMPVRFEADTIKAQFEKYASSHKDLTLTYSQTKTDKSSSISVEIESPFSKVGKIRLVKDVKPRIAIILDDWGYGPKDLPYLKSIKQVFTASVLPGLKYSQKAAEEAHANLKGVMLHLPMQPTRKMPMEKDTILAGMSTGEITRIVDKHISQIPYFTGVNNHEGSLVTEKKDEMKAILEILKDRGLFFVDSLTSAKTVAYKTAIEIGVPAGKRNIFIDNKKKGDYNEAQINKLKAVAKANGWAIGIGHDDPVTLDTLSRMMPAIEAEGFEFVYVAELLQ